MDRNNKSSKHQARLGIRLPPAEMQAINERAKDLGISTTRLIRFAARQALHMTEDPERLTRAQLRELATA